MKYVFGMNWFFIILWIGLLFFSNYSSIGREQFVWIEMLTFAGVILLQVGLYFRVQTLFGFFLVLLYVLALLRGLSFMLSADRIFTFEGAFFMLLDVLLILYFIGVRGFLRSDLGRQYLGLPLIPSADED